MQFKIKWCQCGVAAPHIRIVSEKTGRCSRPFFSQEAVLRDYANKFFWHIVQGQDPASIMCDKPDDSREAHRMFVRCLDNLPSTTRATYDDLAAFLNVKGLPVTDQEAWDALSEEVKRPVRDFYNKGYSAVDKKDLPGAFGTEWEFASIRGTNPPDNLDAKCNILSMLYAPIDYPGTLER